MQPQVLSVNLLVFKRYSLDDLVSCVFSMLKRDESDRYVIIFGGFAKFAPVCMASMLLIETIMTEMVG